MSILPKLDTSAVLGLNTSTQLPNTVSSSEYKLDEIQTKATKIAADRVLRPCDELKSPHLTSHQKRDLNRISRPNLLDDNSLKPSRGRKNSASKIIRFTDEDQKRFMDAAEQRIQKGWSQEHSQPLKIALSPKSQAIVANDQRAIFKASRKASPFVYRKIGNYILEHISNPTPCQMKAAKAVGIVVSALSVVGALNDLTRTFARKNKVCLPNHTKPKK